MQELLKKLLIYLRGMWRYRWHAMALTWLIVSIGWYMVYKLPDIYKVSAIVHVNTESILRPLLQGMVIEPNIEQRLRLLSRTLKARPNMTKLAKMSELEINKDAPSKLKISLEDLISNIELTNSRTEENIYTISYQNTNPEIAKVVVDNLLKIIIEKTMERTDDSSSSAEKFLNEQLSIYKNRLYEAEERLKEFKRSNAALMPSLGQGYFANLQAVRESLANAELELNEAIKRRDELKRQISGEEPVFGFASPYTEQAFPHPLDSQLQELQKQLNELLLQYTELHPKVSTLKESIERLENIKQKDLANRPKVKNTSPALETNPVYQQLSVSLSEAEAQAASLRVRVREYNQREENLRQMVDTIPQFEAELNRLNRDVEVQQEYYNEMLERLETAIISTEVEQTGGTVEFKVLDPPRLPQVPTGPNRILFNNVILVFGIGAGLGLAFLIAEIRPVVYETQVLNNITGFPVFGIVSKIITQEEKKKERIEYGGYISAFMLLIATLVGTLFLQQ
jgi:polysaccharide chain length determinant protein (PEP-CTERM system associated)